jgi:hypothetical protein
MKLIRRWHDLPLFEVDVNSGKPTGYVNFVCEVRCHLLLPARWLHQGQHRREKKRERERERERERRGRGEGEGVCVCARARVRVSVRV